MSRRKRKRRAAERSKQQQESGKNSDSRQEPSQLSIDPPRPNVAMLVISSVLLGGWLVFLLVVALSR